MTDGATRMVFLGFGKWARADRIYALEPITGDERGGGRRTRVWIDGIAEPILAGRTERTILHDMGQDVAVASATHADAPALAERGVQAARAASPSGWSRRSTRARSTCATSDVARGGCSRRRRSRPRPSSCSKHAGGG